MAQYNTLVGAVNMVYQHEGGTYTENTATKLIQVASELFDAIEADLKTQPDSVEVVARVYYEDIVKVITRHAHES